MKIIEGGRAPSPTDRARNLDVQSLLRAWTDPALLLDRAGRIVDANQPAERLMARSRNELLEANADRVLDDASGAVEDGPQSLAKRALRGEPVESGRQFSRPGNGERFPVSVAIHPVCDSSGQLAGALLVIKDLTEVNHLQRELEQSERHLAVGEMTAGLVHDFSNVLGTMSAALRVLDAGQSSEHDRAVLQILRNAVQSGSQTLDNVRQYLSGKKRQAVRVELRQLLEEVLDLTNPVLNNHNGISVVRDMQGCAAVEANQDELRRAFTNLVLNALEAMPRKGTLTVACRQTPDCVVVSVRDTGMGIPAEQQKRIFSAYFTTKAKGTGLGLAGARRAVEAHGGNIRFESVPGQGTTFFVTLPRIAAEEPEVLGQTPAARHKVS